jgi:preprotein translocase subunit SecD
MRRVGAILVALILIASASAPASVIVSLTVLRAEVGADMATGQPVLTITFDPASTEKFAAFTADNVGKRTIVSVAGETIMDPIIREPITQGVVQVSGEWTKPDLERIAGLLAKGATIDVEIADG